MNEYNKGIAQWKRTMSRTGGWIGVDLDGTLAEYVGWHGPYSVGRPVPKMVERVKKWRAAGIEVRILTARATKGADGQPDAAVIFAVQKWCMEHIGEALPVTNEKEYSMIELWDDRAVQVIPNTGERADGQADACCYDGNCDTCLEGADDEA
jgi:hypothetical protein